MIGCREIQTHYQYVDSGVRDVNLKLDNEWDAYQRSKNGAKYGHNVCCSVRCSVLVEFRMH